MKLASIELISDIKPHPNADKLELATVLGWQTVVKKGEYNVGDKIVFINIDTIVPLYHWSEFLADKNNPNKPIRIKNIKLRGEYSSGLVVSIKMFTPQFASYPVGEDVSDILGITKYIKELPANLSGDSAGDFPTHIISKTDEDNGLSDLELVKEVLSHDSITITRKLDGSSVTIICDNGVITQVCSRNLSKKDTDNSLFWKVAKKLSIPTGWSGVIQGELMGNGVQGNQLRMEDHAIFVFQIMVEKDGKRSYMTYDEMSRFCANELHCDVVPFISHLQKDKTYEMWTDPLQKLQALADSQTLPTGKPAEGIVIRPYTYICSYKSRRPLGFKLINRNYNDT